MNTFFFHYSDDENDLFYYTESEDNEQYSSNCEHEDMRKHEDDDDKSLSSTASLSTVSSKESFSISTVSDTDSFVASRHVTFDDCANVYHEHPMWSADDKEEDYEETPSLWYTAEDYQHFRFSATCMAKMINKHASMSFKRVLEKSYQECSSHNHGNNNDNTKNNNNEGDEEDDDENDNFLNQLLSIPPPPHHHHDQNVGQEQRTDCPPPAMRRLLPLFQASNSSAAGCVGLEARLCRTIARDRSRCRKELVKIIYTMQLQKLRDDSFAKLGCFVTTTRRTTTRRSTDDDEYLECLRLQCEAVSRRSRVFARLLAHAHFDAADDPYHSC